MTQRQMQPQGRPAGRGGGAGKPVSMGPPAMDALVFDLPAQDAPPAQD